MSDSEVLRLLEELEARLGDPDARLDPAALEDWNRRFAEAERGAARGPGWTAVLARARQLGDQVAAATADLRSRSLALKAELEDQGRGERALKAYAPPRS